MQTNQQGVALIEQFEGLELRAYPDPATHSEPFTIGYGHTGGVKKGDVITQAQAEEYLKEDLAEAEKAVANLHFQLNSNEFSALVSFAFNEGAGNLQKLASHGKESIANRLLLFNVANHKVMEGLTRRRQAERKLFLTPEIKS